MSAAPKLLVENGLFLTVDGSGRPPFTGWMTVGHDGRILAIGPGDPDPAVLDSQVHDPTADPALPAAARLDATGKIVAPGFVSAHSHLFTSCSRGLGMDQSLYGWVEAMTRYTERASSEDIYWLARHGAVDFVTNGVTTAYDFSDAGLVFRRETDGLSSFTEEVPDVGFQHAQLLGKLDAGIRHVHSVMLGQTADADAVVAHIDEVVAAAADVASDPLHLSLSISGSVQWAPSPLTAELEVAAMRRHGLGNQPHFLETPHEVELQRSKFGWYREAGALGPDLVFGHFIQTTDEILVEAAVAGCGMVWLPASNGRLASGIANVPRARELGMRVGVGLDDQSCTDVSDPFMNMRVGIFLQRAHAKDPTSMPVADMLELHTRGSAQVLGIDGDVGSLEVGKYADFLVVDPRRPDTGPIWDAVGTYVLACGLRNLVGVYVAGDLVADRDGLVDRAVADETSDQTHERLARIRHDVDGGLST
jgi:cytosine/adenosine deaminase-related metal-dependent hydrolase